jgi:hypothetical protein
VSRTDISIADRTELLLEVRCAEKYQVTMPEFGDKLEQFGIADYSAPPPRLTGDGELLYRRSYTLEPFLSGTYTIPAMEVRFSEAPLVGTPASPAKAAETPSGSAADQQAASVEHTVTSEDVTITVRSLLPGKTDLTLKEIAGPVEMPSSPFRWLFWLLGAIAVVVSGVTLFLFQHRRRKEKAAPPLPPHEVAFARLEALLAENLVEAGEIKQFYLGLSAILRHYIEERFGLRAPERTTEEFLAELRSTDLLLQDHKQLLADFLVHCDLVKFADLHPESGEIQQTFDSCKRFIVETAPRDSAKEQG